MPEQWKDSQPQTTTDAGYQVALGGQLTLLSTKWGKSHHVQLPSLCSAVWGQWGKGNPGNDSSLDQPKLMSKYRSYSLEQVESGTSKRRASREPTLVSRLAKNKAKPEASRMTRWIGRVASGRTYDQNQFSFSNGYTANSISKPDLQLGVVSDWVLEMRALYATLEPRWLR